MKICKGCKDELDESKFYFLGFYRKSGKKALSSYCKPCDCIRVNPNKKKSYYNPHTNKRVKEAIREEIFIDHSTLYLLLKKIELNHLEIDMVDGFRLASIYVDVFGDDLPDYYNEIEQLDIMYYKLNEYMNTNQQEAT